MGRRELWDSRAWVATVDPVPRTDLHRTGTDVRFVADEEMGECVH